MSNIMDIEQTVRESLENTVDKNLVGSLFNKTEETGPSTKKIIECPEIPLLEGSTYYQGKVRANFFGGKLYSQDIPLRVIVATDQISTHDTVRGTIPFKGQILTAISNQMLQYTSGLIGSSQLAAPGPMVVISENCEPIDFEMVLRAYMAKSSTETSLYHHYTILGERIFCGHRLPEGLVANGRLPYVMDTPSTKVRDVEGAHDESVPSLYLIEHSILAPEEYGLILGGTMMDFRKISDLMKAKGIIIADTKFEVGRAKDGKIVYIDEVLTPDASRFWLSQDYEEKLSAGKEPTSYSKQIARDIGIPGQQYTDSERVAIGIRFIETYEHLMGKGFVPDLRNARQAIVEDINNGLENLVG